MNLSGPHRHSETGVLFIIFFIVFFNSPCYASSTTPPENHTAISNSSTPHECIKLFHDKKNFSDACSTCKDSGGELYGIKVITQQPNTEIQKIFIAALKERSGIWVDVPNKTFCEQNETRNCSKALTDTNTTVTNIPCSSNLEFFCYYNDKEPGDANCSPATPLTTTTSGKVMDTASPTPPPKDKFNILPIVIPAIVLLIVIAIAAGCFVIKRSGKQIKSAVKDESGGNLEPENETREAYQIPLNDIIVRSEEVDEDPDEETYNIPRLPSKNGSESQVTESDGKKIYDHLRLGEKGDDYDTTCLSRSGKQIKNAVKDESGGNLKPEIETREAYQIPLNDIIVRSEEVDEDPDEETYNILRLSSKNGSESLVTESDGKKIYDHLRFGEKEDDYDTTCLSRLDGGPVDKPYDKTYFG